MDLNIILSVALSFAYCSGQGQYVGDIACNTEGKIDRCPVAKECTVTCPASCSSERSGKIIRGTRIYASDSPICRSAVHDYRIAPNSPTTNVTLVRSSDDTRKYLGSIQQAISSINTIGFKGYFYFSSPYITEDEILDVSTLNYDYLYQRNKPYIQECRIAGDKATIQDFQFYVPLTANRNGVPTSAGGQEVSWTKPSLQPGGYWCNIANNTYSDVMSLAMPSDAHTLPAEWTITTSIQEKVVIKFVLNQEVLFPRAITWKKDRIDLYLFPNMRQSQNETGYYLEIENVDVGDAGIYGIGFDQELDSSERRGIVRLIVRRCRKGFFGPSCDQECPDCQNGGVCHDVMGSCICPPGFHGTRCEKSCPTGYFGQSCSQSCASSRNAIGESCKGALICLPDPFGCSCAAGYKGLACDEEVITTTVTTPSTRPTTAGRTPTTTPTSTTTSSNTISPQQRMCQTVTTKGRNYTVIQSPSNACQFSCIESGRKIVLPIIKADGEQCKHGICVKGICQETSEKSVCPGDFNGVRNNCKEYCYSVQYPGMSILMNVKDGELCIEEDHHGTCMNGRCVITLHKALN